jgi:hypothetical protein
MSRVQIAAALAAAGLSLCAAPAALAGTSSVGSSAATPIANICVLSFECTYVNYQNGRPTDVVNRAGTLVDWSVNAGSVGGQVRLRVLRPAGNGRFKLRSSSVIRTIAAPGENTFAAHLKVRRGDVLALTNATSGIYMAAAPAGTCVRYFDAPIAGGVAGKPNRVSPQLHLLLSGHVTR